MKLHALKTPKNSRRPERRVGRGTGSGIGKTSGKGTKGQLARSGPGLPAWFEGGQTPIHMRIPKLRGFKNRFRVDFVAVNVSALEANAVDGKVTIDTLAAKGILGAGAKVKILGNGVVGSKLEVHAHAASATARAKIEAAGGHLVFIQA